MSAFGDVSFEVLLHAHLETNLGHVYHLMDSFDVTIITVKEEREQKPLRNVQKVESVDQM